MRGGLQPKRDHLSIRRGRILSSKGFDAGLPELARTITLGSGMPKNWSEIAESLCSPGERRSQVFARDRDGQIGGKTELAAVSIDREIHALADVLARQIKKRRRRLQDCRLNPQVSGA